MDAMRLEDDDPCSVWAGDSSEHHGTNRWQPLAGGHRAAEDGPVLDCLRAVAKAAGSLCPKGTCSRTRGSRVQNGTSEDSGSSASA